MREVVKMFSITNNFIPFGIQAIGTSYCDGTYYKETKSSLFYTIEYILEGYGTIINDGKEFNAGPGDIVVLPIGVPHTLKSSKDKPWTKVWINFYGDIIPTLYNSYNISNKIVYHPTKSNIRSLVTNFLEISHSSVYDTKKFTSISLIIHEIFIELDLLNKLEPNPLNHEMHKIKQYLSNNADSGMTINDVCNKFNISRSYLFKHFKEMFNISPNSFYQQERLKIAKQYLQFSNLTIQEISDTMNFADQHYFSNWFKSNAGISPSLYKSQISKK